MGWAVEDVGDGAEEFGFAGTDFVVRGDGVGAGVEHRFFDKRRSFGEAIESCIEVGDAGILRTEERPTLGSAQLFPTNVESLDRFSGRLPARFDEAAKPKQAANYFPFAASSGRGIVEFVLRATTLLLITGLAMLARIASSDEKIPDKPAQSADAVNEETFVQPKTLAQLLKLHPGELKKVDVARINLLCAERLRGSEDLDVEEVLRTLDAWANHVQRETKRNFHHFLERPKEFNNSVPYYQMGMLGTVLAEDLRIRYEPEHERELLENAVESRSVEQWNVFFGSSRDIFVHGLLGGKHFGTCASMPFLYVAIGQRLGYPITVAARKYHLYVRYEGANGEHLNVEATEHLGFATPTDDEYRNGPFPMTQEQIDGCGWMRPLDNKEILGICLLNRANCLRSMKKHNEEINTLADAARYLPQTAMMKRIIQKNQKLARELHASDRWDQLWDEVEALFLPTSGPMFEHFRNRKLEVQLSMNQSTNLAEIETLVTGLKDELRVFRNRISDYPAKIAESYQPPKPAEDRQKFLALLAAGPQVRRIRIQQEKVPPEYWNGIPPELQKRLQKLTTEQEIVEEMHSYATEEVNLRSWEAMRSLIHPPLPAFPLPSGQTNKVNIRPEDVPLPWRGRPVPAELKERIAEVNMLNQPPSAREMRVREEINDFFIDQEQLRFSLDAVRKRRSLVDQQPSAGPPWQIEIIPAVAQKAPAPAPPQEPDLLLTPQPEGQIKATEKGRP